MKDAVTLSDTTNYFQCGLEYIILEHAYNDGNYIRKRNVKDVLVDEWTFNITAEISNGPIVSGFSESGFFVVRFNEIDDGRVFMFSMIRNSDGSEFTNSIALNDALGSICDVTFSVSRKTSKVFIGINNNNEIFDFSHRDSKYGTILSGRISTHSYIDNDIYYGKIHKLQLYDTWVDEILSDQISPVMDLDFSRKTKAKIWDKSGNYIFADIENEYAHISEENYNLLIEERTKRGKS